MAPPGPCPQIADTFDTIIPHLLRKTAGIFLLTKHQRTRERDSYSKINANIAADLGKHVAGGKCHQFKIRWIPS